MISERKQKFLAHQYKGSSAFLARISEVCEAQENRFEAPRRDLERGGWVDTAELLLAQDQELAQLDRAFAWMIDRADEDFVGWQDLTS